MSESVGVKGKASGVPGLEGVGDCEGYLCDGGEQIWLPPVRLGLGSTQAREMAVPAQVLPTPLQATYCKMLWPESVGPSLAEVWILLSYCRRRPGHCPFGPASRTHDRARKSSTNTWGIARCVKSSPCLSPTPKPICAPDRPSWSPSACRCSCPLGTATSLPRAAYQEHSHPSPPCPSAPALTCLLLLLLKDPLPWSVCPLNGNRTGYDEECEKASSTQYFWYRKTLNIAPSIQDSGGVQWEQVLCLILAWLVVYLCILRGTESTGKVSRHRLPPGCGSHAGRRAQMASLARTPCEVTVNVAGGT